MSRKPSAAAAHIGVRIADVRKSKDWTQERLTVESGIDAATIRSYENGRAMMGIPTLIKLAEALDTPPGYFLEDVTRDMLP